MSRVAVAKICVVTGLIGFLASCASARPPAPGSERDGPCDDGRCIAGVTNFGKVSANLWRGAKPTAEGFRALEANGVITIVDLESKFEDQTIQHRQADCDLMKGTHLNYVSVPAHEWHPEEEDLVALLKVLGNPRSGIVYVHCAAGENRTGAMVGGYRRVVDGWTVEKTEAEMKAFGVASIWTPANESFIRTLDESEAMRIKALVGAREELPLQGCGK